MLCTCVCIVRCALCVVRCARVRGFACTQEPALKELRTKSKSKSTRYALVQVGSHPPYHSFVARPGKFTADVSAPWSCW